MQSDFHHTYSRYLQRVFGGKTYKVVVNSGLTCPTRDGAISKGGCAFCDVRGSSSYFGKIGRAASVTEQIEKRLPAIRARFSADKFLAYFQSYTNTYSDAEYLRGIYEAALAVPEIAGLCIGTRPDCLPDSVIELLEELAQKHYVSLELGVQSFEDPALEWLDRGHDGQCSIDAFKKLARMAPSVHTCAHFIFGSPPDSPTAARDAALLLNDLGVKGAKLHQLMVLKHTKLEERFATEPFKVLTLEEYSDVVAQFLDHLSPEIYVERLAAKSSHPDECIAPEWSRQHWDTHNRLRELLSAKGCVQGRAIQQPYQPLIQSAQAG